MDLMRSRLLIKAGVDISRLERNTRRALQKVYNVYNNHNLELVITSTYEGNHGAGSLHYGNQAFDFNRPPVNKLLIYKEIKEILGSDFDFVREVDHWHLEYDPE